jgi:hypothetical protein
VSDTIARLSESESLSELLPDLHYGVIAEVEECLGKILTLLQSEIEETMNRKNPIGSSNSPQPTLFLPSTKVGGLLIPRPLMAKATAQSHTRSFTQSCLHRLARPFDGAFKGGFAV